MRLTPSCIASASCRQREGPFAGAARRLSMRRGGDLRAEPHHGSIVNAAVSRWRKGRRTTAVEAPEEWGRPSSERSLADDVADADTAWRLCGELPPLQRAAVVLRYFEDYSFAEVAAALGCPEATARSHVHRALTRLRTRLVGGPE